MHTVGQSKLGHGTLSPRLEPQGTVNETGNVCRECSFNSLSFALYSWCASLTTPLFKIKAAAVHPPTPHEVGLWSSQPFRPKMTVVRRYCSRLKTPRFSDYSNSFLPQPPFSAGKKYWFMPNFDMVQKRGHWSKHKLWWTSDSSLQKQQRKKQRALAY